MGNIDDAVNEAGLSNRSRLANTLRALRAAGAPDVGFFSDLEQEVPFDDTFTTIASVVASGHIAGDRWVAQGFLQLDSLSATSAVTARVDVGDEFTYNPLAVFTPSNVDGGLAGSASLTTVYVAVSSDPFPVSLMCSAEPGESGVITGTITLTNMGQP